MSHKTGSMMAKRGKMCSSEVWWREFRSACFLLLLYIEMWRGHQAISIIMETRGGKSSVQIYVW